jgi:P-type Cu+ transporter
VSGQVVDPACGMKVDPVKSAGSFEYKGTTYHFCGLRCLEKFKNDPDGVLARGVPKAVPKKSSAPMPVGPGAPLYTCPMHPEIRQNHPESCPKCGMALESVAPAQPLSKTEDVCPMHPQIVRSEPCNCPICGMTLERRRERVSGAMATAAHVHRRGNTPAKSRARGTVFEARRLHRR